MGEAAEASESLTQYHAVMFQRPIRRDEVRQLQGRLDAVIKSPPEETAIDLWIESPGGDAHAAYKLFLDIRSRCTRFRVIVPDYAKSAATLLALGADEIFMGPAAELGPLDVQVEHPGREGVIVSGLNVTGSIEFISETALKLVVEGGAGLLATTQLPRQEVLGTVTRFAAMLLRPAIDKIDPHLIHRAAGQLKVAERYATTMLRMRSTGSEHALSDEDAQAFVERLVRDYPVHEFIISRQEARQLKLPISEAERHPRWPQIHALHRQSIDERNAVLAVFPDVTFDKSVINDEVNRAVVVPGGDVPNEARSPEGSEGAARAEPEAEAQEERGPDRATRSAI